MGFLDEIKKGGFKLKKTVTRVNEVPPDLKKEVSKVKIIHFCSKKLTISGGLFERTSSS